MQHVEYRLSNSNNKNLITRITNAKHAIPGQDNPASSRKIVKSRKNPKLRDIPKKPGFNSFTQVDGHSFSRKNIDVRDTSNGHDHSPRFERKNSTSKQLATNLVQKNIINGANKDKWKMFEKSLISKRRSPKHEPVPQSDNAISLGSTNFTVKHVKKHSVTNATNFVRKYMPDKHSNLSFKSTPFVETKPPKHVTEGSDEPILNDAYRQSETNIIKQSRKIHVGKTDKLFVDMRKKFNITAVVTAMQNMVPDQEHATGHATMPIKHTSDRLVLPVPKPGLRDVPFLSNKSVNPPKSTQDLFRRKTYRDDEYLSKKRTVLKSVQITKTTLPINKEHQSAMDGIAMRYTDFELMGQGSFSCIYKAVDKLTQKIVALKITKSRKGELAKEYAILSALSHTNIIGAIDLIDDAQSGQAILVMEFGGAKNLKEYQITLENKVMAEPLVARLIERIIDGLAHMHNKKIAHCDIKVENVGIDLNEPWMVKILDFGFADVYREKIDSFFCGTTAYMSPQLLSKKSFCPFKADVWALGVLAYKMMFYMFPFKGKNDEDVLSKIKLGKLNYPSNIKCSQAMKGFFALCFTFDENKRPTMVQVKEYYARNVVNKD